MLSIITAIAYPNYANYVNKARRADGKTILLQVMQAQQRNYTANSTNVVDMTKIGFDVGAGVLSEGDHYAVSAAA